MKKYLSLVAIAGAATLASSPAMAATTLTFSSACGGLCANGADISQSYGDIAGLLNISYRSVASNGSAATIGTARSWTSEYGNLTDVVWGAEGGTLEIAFNLLAPGKQITLNSVDYAAWGGADVSTKIALYALANAGGFYTSTLASSALTAPAIGHSTWAPNLTSANGFVLHFGPDGYNGGLDNLTFTISDVAAVAAVPEPATWLSMIVGFGLVGAADRRRASRSVAAII